MIRSVSGYPARCYLKGGSLDGLIIYYYVVVLVEWKKVWFGVGGFGVFITKVIRIMLLVW